MTIKFAIITCSDTRTLETDEAGQKLEQLIAEQGWECVRRVVEMDERPFIAGALIDACDNTDADIVLTCGGFVEGANFGYEYFCGIAKMFGIPETRFVAAEGLDIVGIDVEAQMDKARAQIAALD